MNDIFRGFLGAAIGIATVLTVISCDDADDGPCVQGEACICTDDCEEECDGAGCGFECKDGADCSFDCPGGNCSMECAGAASCELSCSGGGCSTNCTGTGTCLVTDCTQGCQLVCGGSQDCSSSCGPEANCQTLP